MGSFQSGSLVTTYKAYEDSGAFEIALPDAAANWPQVLDALLCLCSERSPQGVHHDNFLQGHIALESFSWTSALSCNLDHSALNLESVLNLKP